MKVFINAGFKVLIGTLVAYTKIATIGSTGELQKYSVLPIVIGTIIVIWGIIDLLREILNRTQ